MPIIVVSMKSLWSCPKRSLDYALGTYKEISHTRALLGCSAGPLGVLARRVHHNTRSTSWQRREAKQWLVSLPEEVGAPPSLLRSRPHTTTTHDATAWPRRPQPATPPCGDGREGSGSWVSYRVERGASHVPQALPTLSSHRSVVRQIGRFLERFGRLEGLLDLWRVA